MTDPVIMAAIERLRREYPVKSPQLEPARKYAHANIAETCMRYVPRGGKILDFGCGAAGKTAVLQYLGYACTGVDDMQEPWHLMPGMEEKIFRFIKSAGIEFIKIQGNEPLPFELESFDMVMCHDVLEHLHDSPKAIFEELIKFLKPGGVVYATVPNAVNIRKRIDVLRGKTNHMPYDDYYFNGHPWRGHVREYVRDDLDKFARYLGLEILELTGVDHMLRKLPRGLTTLYLAVTAIFPDWKDTWQLVARKPVGDWRPVTAWVPAASEH